MVTPTEAELTEFRQHSSFAHPFDELYASIQQLKAECGEESVEFRNASSLLIQFTIWFWKNQTTLQSQERGSFGYDNNGKDQVALCMTISTDKELSICKWGLQMNEDGDNLPIIELLVSPHWKRPEGLDESDHVYNINIDENSAKIVRTNWNLKPGQSKKEELFIDLK